jgi:hypothetical protein
MLNTLELDTVALQISFMPAYSLKESDSLQFLLIKCPKEADSLSEMVCSFGISDDWNDAVQKLTNSRHNSVEFK